MKTRVTASIASLCLFLGSGCQSPAPTDSSAQIGQLEARIASLEAKVEVLVAGQNGRQAAEPVAVTPTASPVATSSPDAGSSPSPAFSSETASADIDDSGTPLWKSLNYDTLPSEQRLKELVSLGFLPKGGIVDQTTFEGGLTRGQYIALLVEMNNTVHNEANKIRLARDGDGQTFDDVPPSHPYYKYIQGMVDSGFVIGFDEKTFQPDKALTREEMVAIVSKRDYSFKDYKSDFHWKHYVKFTDKDDIAPKYRDAIAKDAASGDRSNLSDAFGETKLLHPKRDVRAYEAILSFTRLGDYSGSHYNKLVKEAMAQ